MDSEAVEVQWLDRLEQERTRALQMIASGAPMRDCLDALTDAVARLACGTRACVLLASEDRTAMGDGYSSHFPPSFAAAVRGLPIGEALIGTCGAAIHGGRPVMCPDVEHSGLWAAPWRRLCLDNGILACYSHPAIGWGGRAVASFFLCLPQAREVTAWERRVAEFGALAASIVIERDRTTGRLRQEMQALGRLQALSNELVGTGQLEPLLQKILAAAADLTGTDKGNIQIFDPDRRTLRIVVHQGLGRRLVEHFAEDGWDASCGRAARQIERLVIEDVEKLDALRGTPGLDIVIADGIRSIQCTPLVSRDGRLLGMLNNHYRRPGGPEPQALRYIDLLARQAAELVERHQQERALAEERRRKDEFLALLAHELRNPLAALRNMLEVLKRCAGDRGLARQARDTMERQLLQLVRLVDDLLDVNRIARGKLALQLAPVALASVVQRAVETCSPLVAQRGHRLRVELPPAPLRLHGDAVRLTQVLANLLTNACKYTPAGGDIRLRAVAGDGVVDIAVQDNGAGIPPDQLDAIFGMFTQVERTRAQAQGGLGIGLTLVRQLVEMHGGTVRALSRGLGEGSEFVVRLPLAGNAAPTTAAAPPCAGAKRRVLVVDDNRDSAQSLAALLALEGHETALAFDGEQALQLAGQFGPDLVILDIGMPDMSGHEVCRRIRASAWGGRVRIVALTGWGQQEDRRRSQQAGFDHHLVKPVDPAAMAALLASA
jgi:signal transduction histidine kinase